MMKVIQEPFHFFYDYEILNNLEQTDLQTSLLCNNRGGLGLKTGPDIRHLHYVYQVDPLFFNMLLIWESVTGKSSLKRTYMFSEQVIVMGTKGTRVIAHACLINKSACLTART